MKKITYSLNYRKPKDEYTENCELTVCVRYYQKLDDGKHKVVKKRPIELRGKKCAIFGSGGNSSFGRFTVFGVERA